MGSDPLVHVYLFSFPGQGHVNPLLRLGKRLASSGLLVTFSTVDDFGKRMLRTNPRLGPDPTPLGDGFIRFEFLDDGLTEADPCRSDLDAYVAHMERVGRSLLPEMLRRHADAGRPVSCLINNPFIPWVSDVAAELGVPSAMLWVQSAAAFSCYYHYYHNLVPFPSADDPEVDVEVPYLPVLKHDEIPSFLHPSTPYAFLRRAILGQYRNLSKPFCVLMETFDELEHDIIGHISKFVSDVKPVGPLYKICSAEAAAAAVRGDSMPATDGCVEWLDQKPARSVVYVSFGTVVQLQQEQVEEMAAGLLSSGLSFLWVLREPHAVPEGLVEAAGERGKVVEWAPQEAVLAHPSVGCFVTHCGWNSTMEALSSGVPVAAFPQWGDQVTDAKFLVDVFGVGVRLCRGDAAKRLVTREEIKEGLLEATVGPRVEEMRRRAAEWKKAAEAAVAAGGSSCRNLEEFVEELRRKSVELRSAETGAQPTARVESQESRAVENSTVEGVDLAEGNAR